MTILEAIIQGIIQGATEFLPISSSGHLSISQHVFGIELPSLAFDLMLHLGTLISVVFVYRSTLLRLLIEFFKLIADLFRGKFKWQEMDKDRRLLFMLLIGLLPLFLLFAPIPGANMQVKDFSELLATDSSILAEGIALLVTSILLFIGIRMHKSISTEKIVTNSSGQISASSGRRKIHAIDAILIGMAQCFAAIFPGLSRSGSTLSVGLMRGINKQTALDYSFVLGIPAILAANLMAFKDLSGDANAIGAAQLVAGVITAAITGFLAIKVLKWIVSSDKLHVFAYYTLIVGGIVTILGAIEKITGTNIFTGAPL